MTTQLTKRQIAILSRMAEGFEIRRVWSGGDMGYLSHRLDGIKVLKEVECVAMRNAGLIDYARSTQRFFSAFSPYVITDAGREALKGSQQ